MLHNAVGGGRVSDFLKKTFTKKYGSSLLALRGGRMGVEFPEKKRYVPREILMAPKLRQIQD